MSGLLEFTRWRFSRVCTIHERGDVCTCTEQEKTRLWLLHGTSGAIQQFLGDGPYYGIWDDGRTGAMTTLDGCKAAVEKAVWHG
ncbi:MULTISPECIES: hypothetical protein [Phyllobacteriaceae]|jgi:hypothetical protein|uniref:Uncharacterized protein n=1 Tax=Mesorhizobium hungaricum TaxID=1566387 RepID=A0A1C2DDC7_9HYPH|nr:MULTISPECIES: hypothetical protein [Mesorhizobium]MBN9235168.1 hypothetical protein [Mesorhizobium sp.]OCX12636.1 hypothetical protein QV13_23855 [Mesorhizobium hungaricum]